MQAKKKSDIIILGSAARKFYHHCLRQTYLIRK